VLVARLYVDAAGTTAKVADVRTTEIRSHSSQDSLVAEEACSSVSGDNFDSMHELIISCHPNRGVFHCDLEGRVFVDSDRNRTKDAVLKRHAKGKLMDLHLSTYVQ
jgi:hypothetical protein